MSKSSLKDNSDDDLLQLLEQEASSSESDNPNELCYVSSICSFRRALDSDIPEILTLVTDSTYDIFGYTPIEFKIKKCYFSMVAINADNRIVAVICLEDHPNIISIPKCDWESWIKNLYNLENLTSQNTLFINLIAYCPSYMYTFEKPLLENVYLNFPFLIHLIAVIPGNSPSYSFMEENFTCIMPVGYTNPKKVQTLYLTFRHHYIQKCKIRLAVEEDNDDIVHIIDTHSSRLKEMYGEYYLSEILTKFPEMNRKIIVAEVAERAVGVLFLNDNVNYESLIDNFCLEPFLNLHQLAEGNILPQTSFVQSISIEPDFEGTSIKTVAKDYSAGSLLRDDDEEESLSDEELTIADLFDLERLGILVSENSEFQSDSNETSSKLGDSEDDDPVYLGKTNSEFLRPSDSIINFNLHTENAVGFTLEIMAAGEEHETNILNDLLEASFQSFTNTDKKFCVFSVLHNIPHFPLFDYFVRTIPRRNSVYPHEVYVLHRNAIKAQLQVRKLSKRDYNKVKNLVSNISNCTSVIDALTKSLYGSKSKLKTFIMVNMSVIVGIIILQLESNPEYYFERFECYKYVDLNSHRYNRCGMIEFCIVCPIFQKYVQFFLKEIHRLTDMSVLFYKLAKLEIFQRTRTKPIPAILKDMLPVPDRVQPKFTNMQLNDVEVPYCYHERKNEQLALFISTRRLTSLPRYDVNSRIVVVGASCTGLSFLESLIFHYDEMKHVTFNNLYLIYDRTLQRDRENMDKHMPPMFLYRGKFTATHLNAMCFHAHVNYVNGFMTSINRKCKYIAVNKENIIPYDYLFLMCGKQFHQPHARGVRKDKLSEACPQNVFVINKYRDAEKAFEKIYNYSKYKRNPTIVVYGSGLNAYICLSALEKTNLVNSIKFVEPTPDEFERPYVDPFNNPEIFDTFHDLLYLVGIDFYMGYYFHEWEVDLVDNVVTTVKYQSRKGAISFNCDFIFHYANKEVNYDTFTAVNSAGLVYDGKLVIGPDCRTNDPYIFAAGPMTKYSRRYFADKFVHKYYNSHEIGERLGRQVRAMLLPGGLEQNKGDEIFDSLKNKDTNKLVPQYVEPIVDSCMLPGGIYFLQIRSPGKPVPIEAQRQMGNVFETGNLKRIELDEDPEYFRLQLNQQMKVEHIVCLTRKELEVVNFQRIWGKHEQALNNLVTRFKKGLITDFYEYFRTPYFCALYTDTFMDLHYKLADILTLLTTKKGRSLIEDVVSHLSHNNWKKLYRSQVDVIRKKFLCSEYHKKMVEEIMKYLGKYVDYLPMYAHPLVTKLILHDIEHSPLFQKSDSTSVSRLTIF